MTAHRAAVKAGLAHLDRQASLSRRGPTAWSKSPAPG